MKKIRVGKDRERTGPCGTPRGHRSVANNFVSRNRTPEGNLKFPMTYAGIIVKNCAQENNP